MDEYKNVIDILSTTDNVEDGRQLLQDAGYTNLQEQSLAEDYYQWSYREKASEENNINELFLHADLLLRFLCKKRQNIDVFGKKPLRLKC